MLKRILLVLLISIHFSTVPQTETINLISWNIRDFGKTKSKVELEQIAEIVRDADIIAVQEVVAGFGGAQAVAKLTDLLNRKGNKWDYVISDPTKSSKYVTERYAFIWKTRHIKIKNRGRLLSELDAEIDREPFLLDFYVRNRQFTILNFHSRPFNKDPMSEIKALTKFVLNSLGSSVIVAGDFNVDEKEKVFDELKGKGFKASISNQKTTLKRSCDRNNYLNYPIDNIFYTKDLKNMDCGIVDFVGFCGNLENARKLSDHLPVFLRFSLK